MRVRVVDDHRGIAVWLASALEDAGLEAEPVTQGFAGLLRPGAWDGIDAAIVDMRLNGYDLGPEIVRMLAAKRPEITVVVLTGSDDVDPALAGQVKAVLRKPIEASRILQVLGVLADGS